MPAWMPASGLKCGGTRVQHTSATAVQTSVCGVHVGPKTHRLLHLERASATPMAQMPCCIVPGEPARRARDHPDGGQVGHGLLARLRAEEPSDGSLLYMYGLAAHAFSFRVGGRNVIRHVRPRRGLRRIANLKTKYFWKWDSESAVLRIAVLIAPFPSSAALPSAGFVRGWLQVQLQAPATPGSGDTAVVGGSEKRPRSY